jgi:antirestriction protein
MSNEKATLRIYVADMAACDAGHQRGVWIDIDGDTDPGEVRAEIAALLATSPVRAAVEWSIRDHNGYGGIEIGEFDSIERIVAITDLLADHAAEVIAPFVHGWGSRPAAEMRSAFEEAYQGRWETRDHYAEEVLAGEELLAQVPERLRGYLELGRLLRDAERSGALWTVETADGIHVIANTY